MYIMRLETIRTPDQRGFIAIVGQTEQVLQGALPSHLHSCHRHCHHLDVFFDFPVQSNVSSPGPRADSRCAASSSCSGSGSVMMFVFQFVVVVENFVTNLAGLVFPVCSSYSGGRVLL